MPDQCKFRLLGVVLLATRALSAIDKNGVAPQAISLPSGPGSIQGLGESFQPQLNTGSGSTGVKLALPRGPGGITPDLSLVYNSGSGNGSLGLGWSLSGMLSIRRSTDRGIPYYVDGADGLDNDADGQIDNPEELDTFTGANGEELVTLADGSFRAENESAFLRYTRSGGGWEARSRDGRRYVFGVSPQARIESSGRVFEWCLERVIDPNGNAIDYEYLSDPSSAGQKHLRRVRWGNAQSFLALVLGYAAGRPDVVTSMRSGFELKTSLRLDGIDVISHGVPASAHALRADFDGDGGDDALVRRYRFEYQSEVHLSLLARVTQLGSDGVTALPTLTYTYTSWTPPNNVAATVIRSRDAPAEGFNSPSVELIDMNGDGLPDLLSTAGNQHRVSLNRGVDDEGRLSWGPGQPVGNAPTIDLSSDRTHLADATADGLSDLMVKVSNTSFLCFDNTARTSWVNAPFPIRNTDTWPIWPYDGAGGALSRSFDSDYNRSNDVLHTSQNGNQLWLLLPGGRYSRELRFAPLSIDGQVFRFDLPGTHIADLNGDRVQDLVWLQSNRVVYFPNRGRGDFAPPILLPLNSRLSPGEIDRSDFSDIDGDGLVDLTVVRPDLLSGGVRYWLNRFDKGLDGPREVLGLPAQGSGDALRWADMNGNGTTDIVISQAQSAPGEKIVVIDLVPEGKPFLLRQADNGLGRRIHMDYESSTAQMVRAETAGEAWTTRMPVAITVVGRITEEDGLSPPYVQEIKYRDPYYDPVKQEFRGFASAESREAGDASVAAKRARLVFDTGREEACLKGKALSEEILGDDGTLFRRSATAWRTRTLAEGVDGRRVCYAYEEAVDQFLHEGEPVAAHTRSETDFDDYGNAIKERRLGVVGTSGDEIVTERSFDIRLPDWRLDLVSRETTFDGAGHRLAETRSFYDVRGNLERVELWLDSEDRFIVALRQSRDDFGNVVEKIDARNTRRSTDYDSILHAWPVVETIYLGDHDLSMTAGYDLGLGVVTESISFAGERSEFVYDSLGRLTERRSPGGAAETYEYHLGAPVSRVTKRGRENGTGSTLDAHVFSDGYGREVLTKLESETGQWRVGSARNFNSRKLEARSWLPYLSATPDFEPPDPSLPHNEMSYDAEGRLVETLSPDGSRARSVYKPLEIQQFDGVDIANGGNPDVRRSDGLERIVEVEERNGGETYRTRYTWNARGELESIADALGNVKRFRFDSLSRLVEVDDPDRGLTRLTYDDVGNPVQRSNARSQTIAFTYDAANRPLSKIYRGAGAGGADSIETRWHLDVPFGELEFGDGAHGVARNTLGRQAWIEDRSGESHFSYDERGNVEWVLKRVRDAATGLLVPYRTQRQYDLLNREIALVFPDNDLLRFEHGLGSFVIDIRGDGPQAAAILATAEYNANGQPLRLLWGNGAESRFEYDSSQRLRTDTLLAGDGLTELRHEQLSYDLASTLVAVDDLRPASALPASSPRRRSARFAHDELHRLVRASHGLDGSLGVINYVYDALGNLLEQSTPPQGQAGHSTDATVALGAVSYQGGRVNRQGRRPGDPPGPHALTATDNGHKLKYDASGNATAYDSAQLSWDFEDRLERFAGPTSVADYVYDYSGRRVIRRVATGLTREETWQIDAACEVRQDGTLVKYAFLDGRRVARIQGSLDPERETVQYARLVKGWNLIAPALETSLSLRDALGNDATVYEATGASSYLPVSLEAPLALGRALWVHVPAGRLASWRGLPRAVAAGTSSPGPLHAWPRLESFSPALHLEGDPTILVFDAAMRRWLRRDSTVPAFLSDAPQEMGSAQSFWSPEPVRFKTVAAGAVSIDFYHADAVGSIAAITDSNGMLSEERAHYPFGGLRQRYRPGRALSGTDYDFTGHERDGESGLVNTGARSYLDLAGVFLSPDPKFAEVASLGGGSEEDKKSFTSFLSNPQMGNLYAYVMRQPFKYVDPDGLEPGIVHNMPSASSDRSYTYAWKAFAATRTGQESIRSIVHGSRGQVIIREGPVRGGGTSTFEVDTKSRIAVVTIDLSNRAARTPNFDAADAIDDIAKDINRQLRNVDLVLKVSASGDRLRDAFVIEDSAQARRVVTEVYQNTSYLAEPSLDPQQSDFARELKSESSSQ